MSLGFTLGLQLFYLLVVLAIGLGVALWRRWLPLPDRGVLVATVAGVAIFLVATGLMARPYLRVLDAHPEAKRTPAYVETFSPRLRSFLAAPEESWLLGDATLRARAPLPAPEEMSLFPGFRDRPPRARRRARVGVSAEAPNRARRRHRDVRRLVARRTGRRRARSLPDAVSLPLRLRARLGRRPDSGADQHVDVARSRASRRCRALRGRTSAAR